MRKFSLVLSAVLLTVLGPAPTSAASEDWGLNGTYIATSNGDWAKTNDSFHDEATAVSTWTISTTCTTKIDCAGRVDSDQGWSADIQSTNGQWVVKRDVANWEHCADGTSATGAQIYAFYPVDERGYIDLNSTTYAGFDKTTGTSGACGLNRTLVITMPFRLDKVG